MPALIEQEVGLGSNGDLRINKLPSLRESLSRKIDLLPFAPQPLPVEKRGQTDKLRLVGIVSQSMKQGVQPRGRHRGCARIACGWRLDTPDRQTPIDEGGEGAGKPRSRLAPLPFR